MTVYQEIFEVIKQRKADYEAGKAQENSYTAYLFDKGVDKICKKVGEEATETVIAAKNGDNDELKNEINDLLYHVMVLAANQGLEWSDVEKVLDEKRKDRQSEEISSGRQEHLIMCIQRLCVHAQGFFLLYERIFRNLSTQKPFAE